MVSTHECRTSASDSAPKKQQLFDSLNFHEYLPPLSLSPDLNQIMRFRLTQMSFFGGSFQETDEMGKNKTESNKQCCVLGFVFFVLFVWVHTNIQ